MSNLKFSRLCAFVFLAIISLPLNSQTLLNLTTKSSLSHVNSDMYRFFFRLTNMYLPFSIHKGSLPLSIKEMSDVMLSIRDLKEAKSIELSYLDNQLLTKYISLTTATLGSLQQPRTDQRSTNHHKSHLMSLESDEYIFAWDMSFTQKISQHLKKKSTGNRTYQSIFFPHVYGQVGDDFVFSTNIAYRFLYGDIWDTYDPYPEEFSYHQVNGELANGNICLCCTMVTVQ